MVLDLLLGSVSSRIWLVLMVVIGSLAQAPTAIAQTLDGRVLEEGRLSPVPGATVSFLNRELEPVASVTSDAAGRFTLSPPSSGEYYIQAEGLGYAPTRSLLVQVEVDGTLPFEITLTPAPVGLEGFEVNVRSRASTEDLARGTRVDRITRADIEKESLGAADIADVLRSPQLPFLRVRRTEFYEDERDRRFTRPGLCLSIGRQRFDDCRQPLVLLNDVRMYRPEFGLLSIDPNSIEMIEVVGGIEGQALYGPDAEFGVVLIYVR